MAKPLPLDAADDGADFALVAIALGCVEEDAGEPPSNDRSRILVSGAIELHSVLGGAPASVAGSEFPEC